MKVDEALVDAHLPSVEGVGSYATEQVTLTQVGHLEINFFSAKKKAKIS